MPPVAKPIALSADTFEWQRAKLIHTRYGQSWSFLDDNSEFTGQFVSAFPKRESTMRKKGFVEALGRFPAALGSRGWFKTCSDLTAPLEIGFYDDYVAPVDDEGHEIGGRN